MTRTARSELSDCDSDGSRGTFWLTFGRFGNFLVVIQTARGDLSGCDSDGLGGTFWL